MHSRRKKLIPRRKLWIHQGRFSASHLQTRLQLLLFLRQNMVPQPRVNTTDTTAKKASQPWFARTYLCQNISTVRKAKIEEKKYYPKNIYTCTGRKKAIPDDSLYAQIVADSLESGLSLKQSWALVNSNLKKTTKALSPSAQYRNWSRDWHQKVSPSDLSVKEASTRIPRTARPDFSGVYSLAVDLAYILWQMWEKFWKNTTIMMTIKPYQENSIQCIWLCCIWTKL